MTGKLRKDLATICAITLLTTILAVSAKPVTAMSDSDDPHAHHKQQNGAADVSRKTVDYTVPDINMLNQDAERVSLSELFTTEQPVLLNFIFTSCTAICPAMSATFSNVQNKLGADSGKIRMVSVSIDPENDRPGELSAYAERFGAGPQWEFLTGSLEDSIAIQKAFDADRGNKMNHAPSTYLRAGPDSPWVRFDGFTSTDDLVNEIRGIL